MKTSHAFIGTANAASPISQVFPSGVPLCSPSTRDAVLGEQKQLAPVYLIDLRACDPDELERLAQFIAPQFNAGIAEARDFLAKNDEFPVRAINITGVAIPHRLLS